MQTKKVSKLININDVEKSMTERQLNILRAAIDIFSEKGFQAATTAEIAKMANVAEGTIFRYYKTKKDLLFAIPECLADTLLSQAFIDLISEVPNNGYAKFEDFLRSLIINRKNFASTNITLIKVLFQEIAFCPELRDRISQAVLYPARDCMIKAIDNFKERGEIINLPSTAVVNLIFSSVLGYFFSRYIAKLDLGWDDERETDYLVQYIMNGISKAIDN